MVVHGSIIAQFLEVNNTSSIGIEQSKNSRLTNLSGLMLSLLFQNYWKAILAHQLWKLQFQPFHLFLVLLIRKVQTPRGHVIPTSCGSNI